MPLSKGRLDKKVDILEGLHQLYSIALREGHKTAVYLSYNYKWGISHLML